MCKLCNLRGKTWNGSDPVCAFDDKGMLIEDFKSNWKCATLSVLREISYNEDRVIFSNDENASIIDYDGNFIFLKWYKSRGRTDYIKIFNANIYGENCSSDEDLCLQIIYGIEDYEVNDIKLLFNNYFDIKYNEVDTKILNENLTKIKTNSIYGILGSDINSSYPKLLKANDKGLDQFYRDIMLNKFPNATEEDIEDFMIGVNIVLGGSKGVDIR